MTQQNGTHNTQGSVEIEKLSKSSDEDIVKMIQAKDFSTLPTEYQHAVQEEALKRINGAVKAGLRSWGGNNPALRARAYKIGMEALKKYKPDSGAKLNTWVSSNMRKLSRYRDEYTAAMHIPDSVKMDTKYLQELRNKHLEEHGEPASMGWLKDQGGLSKKRFEKAAAAFS